MSETSKVVKVGDWLTVKREYLGRGGESGEVVDVFDDGVALDFYTSRCDDEYISIEHWFWGELELDLRTPQSVVSGTLHV